MTRVATPEAELIARLRAGGTVRLCAVGGSMWPTIRDGAVLAIAPGPIHVGEVVAYAREDRLIVHRVVGLAPTGYLLRGDGLDHTDPPVSAADILGVATVEWQRPLTWRLPRPRELRYLARAAWHRVRERLGRSG